MEIPTHKQKIDVIKRCEEFLNAIPDMIDLMQSIEDFEFNGERKLNQIEIGYAYQVIQKILWMPIAKEHYPQEWLCAKCGKVKVEYGKNCDDCKEIMVDSKVVGLGISEIANND